MLKSLPHSDALNTSFCARSGRSSSIQELLGVKALRVSFSSLQARLKRPSLCLPQYCNATMNTGRALWEGGGYTATKLSEEGVGWKILVCGGLFCGVLMHAPHTKRPLPIEASRGLRLGLRTRVKTP